MTVMSEKAFEDTYGVEPNPDDEGFYWEYEDIRKHNIQDDRIWTARDTEDVDTILTPGYGVVNRFAYVVSKRSRDEDDDGIDYVLIRGVHNEQCPCSWDDLGEKPELDCICYAEEDF